MKYPPKLQEALLRVAFILVAASLVWLSSYQLSSADSFEADFQRFGLRFLPYIQQSNVWLRAQAITESNLSPVAVSPVGAMGLMQFMPRTFDEVSRQLGVTGSPYNPRISIMFGAFYDDKVTRNFLGKRDRQPEDAFLIGLAAYNCGLGCVLRAQERCFDARLICGINPCLPSETREYTKRIRNRFIELKSNPQ